MSINFLTVQVSRQFAVIYFDSYGQFSGSWFHAVPLMLFILENVSEFLFWRHLAGLLQRMICVAAECMLVEWFSYAWCHRSCVGIHFGAGPRNCPKCSARDSPAAPTREAESLDMERTRSTLSSGDSLS